MSKFRSLLVLVTAAICLPLAAQAATPRAILEANYKAMGGSAWDHPALRTDYAYSGQGLTGKTQEIDDLRNGAFVERYDLGPAKGADGYDGRDAWSQDLSGTVTLQDGGDQKALAVNQAYRAANMWWRPDFGGATVEELGQKSQDAQLYDVLQITPKGGTQFTAWFDARTHLLARIIEQRNGRPTTTTFSAYETVAGARMPGKVLVSNGDAKYDQHESLTKAEFLPAQPASRFAPPAHQVDDFSISGGATKTIIPFRLVNNHIYADVHVDGKGPFMFIFDTGGVNLLTPPTAKTLGLEVTGAMQANGAGKGHMQAGLTTVKSLRIGAATITNQPFIVLPLNAMSDVEGVDETGMIGFETFRRFVTRIDYGRHLIELIKPSAFNPATAGTAIPIRFNGNTIEVEARYDGITGNFTVDTGNRGNLDLNTPFVSKNDLRAKAQKGIETATGWGIGGPTFGFVMHGAPLDIGPIRIARPVVTLSTDKAGAMADPTVAGNIGAGILKRFIVTLDYGHARMYLKPVTTKVADLDTFDESGMWINDAPNGFVVVYVTGGGPAQKAGIQKGDVIVAVDGRPASSIRLYDLRETLRDAPPGTVEHLTILRGGVRKVIALTLKDML
ncbi:MAG: aspartyl protease family protein [Alphaproteobacteria bacterium]|nr:aspartyl protease family protein [Alphaproteobacteria bacterium]